MPDSNKTSPQPAILGGLTVPASPGPRRSRSPRTYVIVVSSGMVSVILVALVMLFGSVRGREFAPTHFESRQFSFFEIPWLQWQITPVRRTPLPSTTVTYLRTAGWIQVPAGAPAQWHLVELRRSMLPLFEGHAKLLDDQLFVRHRNTSDSFWQQWSQEHPDLAAILWPVVQRLAERDRYLLVPEILTQAIAAAAPQPLRQSIDDALVDGYLGWAKDLRSAGQVLLAREILDEALMDYPGHPGLLQIRERMRTGDLMQMRDVSDSPASRSVP